MSQPNQGTGRRRTKRRPRQDDRISTIKLKPSLEMSLAEVISSGGSMVRDCRLQSIRLVGAGTQAFRVLLRGGFTNSEIISLAIVPTQSGKLNRKLTMPRRVRNYFLDSHNLLAPDSFLIFTSLEGNFVPYLDFVEFTFLRESPPVLALGQRNELTVKFNRTQSSGTKIELDTSDPDKRPVEKSMYSFQYSGQQYVCVCTDGGSLSLISPTRISGSSTDVRGDRVLYIQ